VALVDGQPLTLGLKPLLEVFLAHRLEVVRRRCEFRRSKASDRLHLVLGLLIAILDIDEVIALIRASDDTANARERLMQIFDLSEIQANYILEMPLRRLTKFSRLELEKEQTELQSIIDELTEILENDKKLRQVVGAELVETAKLYGDDRRTVLLTDAGPLTTSTPIDLEIADEPCHVLMSASGLIARTVTADSLVPGTKRVSHDTIRSYVTTSARSDIGIVTSFGRVLRVHVIGLPILATTASVSVAGGSALKEFVSLQKGETALSLMNLDATDSTLVLVTSQGSVKRVVHDVPNTAMDWNIVRLDDGDSLVSAIQTPESSGQIVIVTDDAQLLRFDASSVRATGRAAGCVAGIKLSPKASAIFGTVLIPTDGMLVATVAGDSGALPGTAARSAKVTALEDFPAKGRGTGGVRCHKFLSGENILTIAGAGPGPLYACGSNGSPIELTNTLGKRDGSGSTLTKPVAHIFALPTA
jgi:DNA gyrase subunit A